MVDLSCYITTFNCGRALINADYFSANFFNPLSSNSSALPPDLIVLSLQELAPLGYSFLGGTFLVPYFARLVQAVHTAASLRWGKLRCGRGEKRGYDGNHSVCQV